MTFAVLALIALNCSPLTFVAVVATLAVVTLEIVCVIRGAALRRE